MKGESHHGIDGQRKRHRRPIGIAEELRLGLNGGRGGAEDLRGWVRNLGEARDGDGEAAAMAAVIFAWTREPTTGSGREEEQWMRTAGDGGISVADGR